MKRQRGFSLIELLIVVAIILIIAAIAIPNLQRARIAANESATVETLRTLNTAEVAYATTYSGGYGKLVELGPGGTDCSVPTSAAACLIDPTLAANATSKAGYNYKEAGQPATYGFNADPVSDGLTAVKHFFTSPDGVIHFKVGGAAGAGDPSI